MIDRAELRGQLRSYLTSDTHPPDIHFKCATEGCVAKAASFMEKIVYEGGNSSYKKEHICERVPEVPSNAAFILIRITLLIPMCRSHEKHYPKRDKVDYEQGRSALWKFFRQNMLQKIMEE